MPRILDESGVILILNLSDIIREDKIRKQDMAYMKSHLQIFQNSMDIKLKYSIYILILDLLIKELISNSFSRNSVSRIRMFSCGEIGVQHHLKMTE